MQALAVDLRGIMQGLEAVNAELSVAAGASGATVSATALADNAELNQFVLKVRPGSGVCEPASFCCWPA